MPYKQKTVAQGRKRNYTKERLAESKTRKAARAARNRARTKLANAGKVSKGDGKVVGHKKSASKGGSNATSNLRVESRRASNRQGGRLQPKAAKRKGGRR